tara:strand:+ start:2880 stop:3068 length:189 start_codon:yes stop_codon:yes gene_type:complete
MSRNSTPQQLLRLVKARQRLQEKNDRKPAHLRQTEDQIEEIARRALRENRINDYGVILKRES